MAWLKFDYATLDKREVAVISRRLGYEDDDLVIAKLIRFWKWFDENTVDGNAPDVTPSFLDRVVRVPGFCNAMVAAGWLIVGEEDGVPFLRLPNFERHNGKTAKDRALTGKRQEVFRGKKGAIMVTAESRPSHDSSNAPGVVFSSPDKIREEKENTPLTPQGVEEEVEDLPVKTEEPPAVARPKPKAKPVEPTELPGFKAFWDAYPSAHGRRVDREGCAKLWASRKLEAEADRIVSHVLFLKTTDDWSKDGGTFVPKVMRYLKERRWEGFDGQAAEASAEVPWFRRGAV